MLGANAQSHHARGYAAQYRYAADDAHDEWWLAVFHQLAFADKVILDTYLYALYELCGELAAFLYGLQRGVSYRGICA